MTDYLFFREAVARAEAMSGLSELGDLVQRAIDRGEISIEAPVPWNVPSGLTYVDLEHDPHFEPKVAICDLDAWLDRLSGKRRPPMPRKSRAIDDTSALEKMHSMIAENPAISPSSAALHFVDLVAGGGTVVSKQRRLQRKYAETYGE